MNTSEQLKAKILQLNHGGVYVFPKSDYRKCEIWKINSVYVLFEIEFMDGPPIYSDTYHVSKVNEMIEKINYWT